MYLTRRDPRQNGGRAQLLDEIVRKRIGADPEIYTGGSIGVLPCRRMIS